MERMTLTNLHPDIVRIEGETGRLDFITEVIHPSAGIWGGEKKEELVTLVYACKCEYGPAGVHHHQALYGPKIISFPDSCKVCNNLVKWSTHEGHEAIPVGEEILDRSHYELYAD